MSPLPEAANIRLRIIHPNIFDASSTHQIAFYVKFEKNSGAAASFSFGLCLGLDKNPGAIVKVAEGCKAGLAGEMLKGQAGAVLT